MIWISIIALVISIISISLTIRKYWVDYKENILNIDVSFKNLYFEYPRIVLELDIINKTKNPVSVTKIELHDANSDIYLEAVFNKTLIAKTKNIRNNSTALPIYLESYNSKKGFFLFKLHSKISKEFYLRLYTNKGIFTTNKLMKQGPLLPLKALEELTIDT
ncbi:hypothetical protein [Staphylococcus agnetis]|uniref:hypothetical protein n=1 Tax=Staphylococcus agnetis TaxID=985762 RepID=UPI00142F7962|nr:hypothetical protein [Staphylococcus agnetis]NJH83773.1 hypothetical protein [Staphylococcus agnetis]